MPVKRFWFECVRVEGRTEIRRMVAAYGTINEVGGFEYVEVTDGHTKTIFKGHHYKNPAEAVAAERRRTREQIRREKNAFAELTRDFREDQRRYRKALVDAAHHLKYLKGPAKAKRVIVVSPPSAGGSEVDFERDFGLSKEQQDTIRNETGHKQR